MSERTFGAILDELQAARRAGDLHAKQRIAALQRFCALAQPIVEEAVVALAERNGQPNRLARVHHAYTATGAGQRETVVHSGPSTPMTLCQLVDELDVAPDIDAIRELRRQFALGRHPDRVTRGERGQATNDMQAANDLIDQAIGARLE